MTFDLSALPALRTAACAVAVALAAAGCAGTVTAPTAAPAPAAAPAAAPIEVSVVAINDLHGHLEPGNVTFTSFADRREHRVLAGGIHTLAGALSAWRKEDGELLFVGAGDLIGASPALSGMWADEPTIEALGMLGMSVSALGNHELDQGKDELLRQQHGGCKSPRPDAACKFRPDFKGAKFSYLAANVTDTTTGKHFLPAYRIVTAKGVKIAFIGAVLRDAMAMVQESGVRGLAFHDEAESINRVIPELKAQGVKAMVVVIHEGGSTSDYIDQPDCQNLRGPIVDIAKKLDPAIRLVISGHTHKGYLCRVDGRVITQAEQYGHFLTRMKLLIDPVTHEIRDVRSTNVVMSPQHFAPDPQLAALLEEVQKRSAAALKRPVAKVAVPSIARRLNAAGEGALGDLVADAQLDAVKHLGVQVAFVNPKGLRQDLMTTEGNVANYGQISVIHPFNNRLILMDLTGAQLRALLEQQMWLDEESPDGRNILQVSEGFSYKWDATRPQGQRVIPGSITLHGKPIEDGKVYRISANNFIAEGGDRMPMFKEGTNRVDTGILDLDVTIAYLQKHDRAGKPAGRETPANRIQRVK